MSRSKQKILFATIAAGGGHVATARAMAEAIESHFPGEFELRVSDFMFDLGLLREDRQHKEFWRWALSRPQLVRAGQRLLDAAPTLTRRTHRLILRRFARAAAEELNRHPVDLVVANHGWLTVGLTRAQQRHALRTPVLSFATEPLDASALWAEPEAERFIVPSRAAKRDLVKMGVGSDKVDVIGYPVRASFLAAPAKARARARLGLRDGFLCLVSLGGEGIGDDPQPWIERLATRGIEVIVMTGRNPALRRRLAAAAELHPRLSLQGFTEDMASFVAAADVVVGKAGPASVFETLAVGRPFVATSYAGLNEREVIRFLERHGLGGLATSVDGVEEAVCRYMDAPALLEEVARKAAELDLRGMSERLARYIVEYARTGSPATRYVTDGLA